MDLENRQSTSSNEEHPSLGNVSMLPASAVWTTLGAAGILLAMFLFYPAYTNGETLSGWTWLACNSTNGFLHGRFVPAAIVVMLWLAWKENRSERLMPSRWGLLILGLGLLFYVASIRTVQPRLALMGVPFAMIGFVYFCFGKKLVKLVLFPAFFFWFTIPVPGLEAILTGNLQTLITQACYRVGLLVGMDLTSLGSTITVKGSDLEIAEGCSGIRSLMALTMIAAVYSYYTQKLLWKKAVLFASAVPLAIIGNFGRIFTILVLTQLGFEDFAKKTYHDWAGLLLFFPIALSGLYLFDYLLNFKERRAKKVKHSYKKSTIVSKESPTS